MPRKYLTVEEISERMHIKIGTARNRLSRGEPMPPSVKVGRRRLFPEEEFDRWMIDHLRANDGIRLGSRVSPRI